VASQQDVQQVIAQMRADLAGRGPQEWENPTLERFLDALPSRLARQGKEPARPDWALIPQILVAGTGYEQHFSCYADD
jgi:hypothetical protein